MKKRAAVCAVIVGAAMALSGCATGQISNDYITITKYKGVEVPKVEGIPEITDESVENNIKTVLEGFSKTKDITDRGAKEGDIVVLDFTARSDGQAVEGGSASDYELTIGAGSLYEGFEDNIVGHNVGDSFEVEHTFAKDYSNTALAGKDVVLEVSVKAIKEKEVPDLTDEFVKTISQKSETVDEYKDEVRELLKENNEEYIKSELAEQAWEAVLDNTEVKEYPKDRLKEEKQSFYDHYEAGAELYEMEFADFLSKMDMTEEAFEEKAEEAAKSNLKEDLAAELIAEKEDINLSDEDYEKAKEELAKEMSYDSVEEMEKEAPEEAVKRYILRDKVRDWVVDNCIQAETED